MNRTFLLAATLGCTLSVAPALAQSGAGYRDYQLGGSVVSVSALAGMPAADIKTIHQRPALLQELPWRRGYAATPGPVDPVQSMLFSFYNDQLFKVVVEYDRTRTEGLTAADMIESLSAVYGTPTPRPARAAASPAGESGTEVAQWVQADQLVVLFRAAYPPVFRLTVTSPRLDALAHTAVAQARVQDEREAPQREVARLKQEADAAQAAQEKARDTNKAAFRP